MPVSTVPPASSQEEDGRSESRGGIAIGLPILGYPLGSHEMSSSVAEGHDPSMGMLTLAQLGLPSQQSSLFAAGSRGLSTGQALADRDEAGHYRRAKHLHPLGVWLRCGS